MKSCNEIKLEYVSFDVFKFVIDITLLILNLILRKIKSKIKYLKYN